jgi:hypothetical protein
MPKCSYCNSTIVVGGVREGDRRFFNQRCRQGGALLEVAQLVPEEEVVKRVASIHQGPCPKCRRIGSIDVHTSHSVWSALVVTKWKSSPRVSCVSCGRKAKVAATLNSLLLGWWGFPWGLILTPIQITKNIWGIATTQQSFAPSPQLERIVRLSLAGELKRAQKAGAVRPPIKSA